MKKFVCLIVLVSASYLLISWGVTGHRTIGLIAERHLTPLARQAVLNLLNGQSLADVSNYADEIRGDKQYNYTAPWHYLNVPSGMSYNEFKRYVQYGTLPNIYSTFLIKLGYLTHPNTLKVNPDQRKLAETDCLKWIVHLVGDMHQPMHISRAEDKGGNSIKLTFNGHKTNLHSLWDSGLIERQGLNDETLTNRIDTVSQATIRDYQKDEVMQWLFESYTASTTLYAEVERNHSLDDSYYNSHIQLVNERLEAAGIRLAGVLNNCFKSGLNSIVIRRHHEDKDYLANANVKPHSGPVRIKMIEQYPTIKIENALKHLGDTVHLCATVTGIKVLENMALVNMDGVYPNQLLTIVLKGNSLKFAKEVDGKLICVTGKVIEYKGKPEIIVTDPQELEY